MIRLSDSPMSRAEFRDALALAHDGMIRTGQGDGEELRALLAQIAEQAPERDPQLDAAARLAYDTQARLERRAKRS
jgi:hypothetical protein